MIFLCINNHAPDSFMTKCQYPAGIVFAASTPAMKKILTLALLLCGIVAGAQDLEGTFTQAKTLKISGRVIKSEGTITYSAPDQLAML